MACSQSGQGVSRSLAICVYLRIMSNRWISFWKVAPWWNTLTVSTTCLSALGVTADGLLVHDLAVDEVDDERALGVDLVGDRRADAALGGLDHAVTLDVAVDEHVRTDAGHAHDVLLAALLEAAVDPHDVVVVGDAAAELFVADVVTLPVVDTGDDVLGREVGLLSHSSCLSLRAAPRPRRWRCRKRGAHRAPNRSRRHPRRREAGGDGAGRRAS